MQSSELQLVQIEPPVPVCVHCDKPMRLVLADRLNPEPFVQFACRVCGWEVVVPHE